MSQSPDIGLNSDGSISDFWISGQSLIKENCHNSRTSNDIDTKLGPVTKLDKKNTTMSKKIVTSLPFFRSTVNLEQFGSRIPDACSVKRLFSLTVTFYLTKTENRTKKSLTELSYYYFEKKYYFWKKMLIFCIKNADIRRIKVVMELKDVFSSLTLTSLRQGVNLRPPPSLHRKPNP